MAEGIISPLNLEAGAGLLQNTGFGLGANISAPIAAYEATSVVSRLLSIQSLAADPSANISPANITALQSLGNSTCPALGDSVPVAYANTAYPIAPTSGAKLIPAASASLFSGIVRSIAQGYLGSGDTGRFAQIYFASQGYIDLVNPFITSAANANTDDYLGVTFSGMDNLITGDLTQVTLALPALGVDLAALGQAIDLAQLENFGTPAALLQQVSALGKIANGTTPAIRDALTAVGLSRQEISDLVNYNVQSLFNPNGLTLPEFNALQKKAYPALCTITGTDLSDVLEILDVTTANLTKMCELLDPIKIFPTSWPALTVPTPSGSKLIFDTSGSVNSNVIPVVTNEAIAPVGCDELGKIIPPGNAVGLKAIQIALQQIKGVSNLTLPQLAAMLV